MRLKNARVWLTGASSGIGEALVRPLVERGARVAITARRRERLDAIAERTHGDAGPPLVVVADVSNRADVQEACGLVERELGGIDIAIFNAGIGRHVFADTLAAEDFEEVFGVNYFGVIYGIEAVVPGMLARGSGHIAAVASLAGYRGVPRLGAYGASKAALIHTLDSLRFDLEPHGVNVTVINPGYVHTPLTAKNRFRMPAIIDAEAAAAIIVDGLERNRREIHFPHRFSWVLKTLRILPFPLYYALVRRIVTAATKGQPR